MRCNMLTSPRTRGNREDKWTTGGGASRGGGVASREREEVAARQQGTTSKGEDLMEVVRIFWELRKNKMGNVTQSGTCMGRGAGPGKLKIVDLLFSDRYLQLSRPWKIKEVGKFWLCPEQKTFFCQV
jgi:hypothetical protein